MVNLRIFIDNVRSYLSDNYIPFQIIDCSNDDELYDEINFRKIQSMSEDIDFPFAYRVFIQTYSTSQYTAPHGNMIIYVGDDNGVLAVTIHNIKVDLANITDLYGFTYSKIDLVSQADNTYRFYFNQNKFNLNLNSRSRELINRIWLDLKYHPMYSSYEIIKDEASYSDAGAIAIKVKLNWSPVLMFLFYPSYGNGNIDSIAVYGNGLDAQKRAIESSMQIFGLPVKSIKWDRGIERFLDVALDSY